MEQVKVDVVCLQLFQLLVQKAVEILNLFDFPAGHLGGQLDPLPVAILKGASQERLTRLPVVGVGCVYIIHAVVNGVPDHARSFRLIDLARVVVDAGQAHGAKAQS